MSLGPLSENYHRLEVAQIEFYGVLLNIVKNESFTYLLQRVQSYKRHVMNGLITATEAHKALLNEIKNHDNIKYCQIKRSPLHLPVGISYSTITSSVPENKKVTGPYDHSKGINIAKFKKYYYSKITGYMILEENLYSFISSIDNQKKYIIKQGNIEKIYSNQEFLDEFEIYQPKSKEEPKPNQNSRIFTRQEYDKYTEALMYDYGNDSDIFADDVTEIKPITFDLVSSPGYHETSINNPFKHRYLNGRLLPNHHFYNY